MVAVVVQGDRWLILVCVLSAVYMEYGLGLWDCILVSGMVG